MNVEALAPKITISMRGSIPDRLEHAFADALLLEATVNFSDEEFGFVDGICCDGDGAR